MILKREIEKNTEKESQPVCDTCFWGQIDTGDALLFSQTDYLFVLCIFENLVEWRWGCRAQDVHDILPARFPLK